MDTQGPALFPVIQQMWGIAWKASDKSMTDKKESERDAVLKRMLKTPPAPRKTSSNLKAPKAAKRSAPTK